MILKSEETVHYISKCRHACCVNAQGADCAARSLSILVIVQALVDRVWPQRLVAGSTTGTLRLVYNYYFIKEFKEFH